MLLTRSNMQSPLLLQQAVRSGYASRCSQALCNRNLTYFLQTFAPDISTGVAAKLDDIFRSTTAKILGLSKEEAIEIAPQTELHPSGGGHGASSSAELAPRLHFASWVSTIQNIRQNHQRSSQLFRLRNYSKLVNFLKI